MPIALAAVKALGQYPKVESMVADQLLLIARDSKDFDLQFEIFTLLVEKAGVTYQRALLADALTSSGQTAQTSARALFYKYIHVQEDVASSVRFQDVQSRSHVIAAMLVMLVALRAASDSRAAIAEHLAISERRRVLLLLMLWAVGDSEAEFQKAVVRLLPESHPAVHLVLSGDLESLDGNSFDDLGDAQAVSVVLSFLKPKKKKTKPAG